MKRIKEIYIFHFLFCLFICLQLPPIAEAQHVGFKNYTMDDGLPQSLIYSIVQDKDGYLLLGSQSGISIFNGLTYENINTESGLPDNIVRSLFFDKNNNLWAGHESGSITVIRDRKIKQVFSAKNGLQIIHIIQDKTGKMWFATLGNGVISYSPEDEVFDTLNIDNGLTSNSINHIYEDHNGYLWFSGTKGIVIYSPKAKELSYLNTEKGLLDNFVTSVIQEKSGKYWITTGKGYSTLDHFQQGKQLAFKHYPTLWRCSGTILDKEEKIWIATQGGGLIKHKGNNSTSYTEENGLYNNNVKFSFVDREGYIWFVAGTGLSQYRGETFKTYLWNKQDETSDAIWGFAKDSYGNYWITGHNKLYKYTPARDNADKDLIENFIQKYDIPIDPRTRFRRIYNDSRGKVWFGFDNKVMIINPKNDHYKILRLKEWPEGTSVYQMNEDKYGRMWIASSKGILRYDVNTGATETFPEEKDLQNILVLSVDVDDRGNLWFTTYGAGLIQYIIDEDRFKFYNEKNGISDRFVSLFARDTSGRIWIGTRSSGIFRQNDNDTTFSEFEVKGIPNSKSPWILIFDDNNNLWMGSNFGVYKINPATKEFTSYGKDDGFIGIEVNQAASMKDEQGRLWFGTVRGFTIYDPKEENQKISKEPLTHITGMKLFFEDYPLRSDLNLTYEQNFLTFEFIGLSFANAKKVGYKIKLQGFDKDWITTKDNYFYYSNLPPGKYTFKVKACNSIGIWNKEPATYSFVIEAPFWQKPWFYLICIILLIGGIYGIFKLRLRNIQKVKETLKYRVEVRTRELNEQKKKLEEAYEALQQKNEKVEQQNEIIAEKNKDITDSIEYAKKILTATMPNKSEFRKITTDLFLLGLPKDIVSGDFFTMRKFGDNIVTILTDCTGHGVPGALMSVIANLLIKDVVNRKDIKEPASFLEALNEEVIKSLSQYNENSEISDGMDMAVCEIDMKNKKIAFAGAVRPIYLVKKDGTLHEYKGSPYSIGGNMVKNKKYMNQIIDYEEGDLLYLFSDGYADQFGGNEGKKFMVGRFRKLIGDLYTKDMQEQKKFLCKTLNDWKGDYEQVDDVLVVGIRLS